MLKKLINGFTGCRFSSRPDPFGATKNAWPFWPEYY